jgi:hypothetical protein
MKPILPRLPPLSIAAFGRHKSQLFQGKRPIDSFLGCGHRF